MALYIPKPVQLFNSAWKAPEMSEMLRAVSRSWLDKSSPESRLRLYHYTDLTGLRGILEHRSFWLTHAYALNDPKELEYGLSMASSMIGHAISAHDPGTPVHRALTQMRISLGTTFGLMQHVFVASFCEGGDILSQWREYGGRGGGYSIGLDISADTQFGIPGADLVERVPFFRKVLYDEGEQRALIQRFLDRFAATVTVAVEGSAKSLLPADERGEAPVWLAAHAANFLFDLAVSFKHPAFAEEREWRWIRAVPDKEAADELRFREARGELVPYRPTHLYTAGEDGGRSFPLGEIYFGPTLNVRATSSALQLLVAHEATREHPISLDTFASVRPASTALR